jgi:mycothiol synthase
MGFLIRDFSFGDSDYEVWAQIETAVDPDHPISAEDVSHYFSALPERCRPYPFIAEDSNRPIGCAFIGRSSFSYHPRKFGVQVYVSEEARGMGVGSALYDAVIGAVADQSPIGFRVRVRENEPHSIRFAEKRGFVEKMREWESALDMAAYNPAAFAHLGERAAQSGITIKSVAELAASDVPDWDRKIHAVEMQTLADVPFSDVFTPSPFEDWRKMALESPHFLPEGFFVALDGDEFIATSGLWRGSREGTLETGLTGVLRDYRRKGVATALKLHALAFAKHSGAAEVRTDNATTNRPMLAINEQFGFEKRPATIFMTKTLADEADDDA